MNSISKIAKNSTYLQITWNDGEESKFNYMWLRDNCPTAHDKDSRHRMFNILEVSKEINPKKYSLNGDGKLEIEWSEGCLLYTSPSPRDGHQSRMPSSA